MRNQNKKQVWQEKVEKVRERMSKVGHKIAIISGKGGVGKSVVTVNLAMAFTINGREGRVGVLDADIHGPCVPKMLGLKGRRLQSGPPGIFPAVGPLGLRVVSMDFLLPEQETPVIWRGPLKYQAIRQFLSDIVWGDLDYLFIDLPPGTGDEALSVLQLLPEMDGVIIVTIPSEVSQDVVKKAVSFAMQLEVPVLGVIENMSGFTCPECGAEIQIFKSGGGETIANDMGVPFLGRIPIDPEICRHSDEGSPFILEHRRSTAAESFMKIVNEVERQLRERKRS